MDHASLVGTFQRSASIKLVQAHLAAFIIAFLYRMFKEPNQAKVSLATLELALEAELVDRATAAFADQQMPERPAQAYLREWADDQHRFIHIVHPLDQAPEYVQLTQETERVLSWVIDLQEQPFVGTESRLLALVRDLQELEVGATVDPQVRLAYLATERARINAEVAEIKESGHVTTLTPRQIEERFHLIHTHARELLRDFRQIEQKIEETSNALQAARVNGALSKAGFVEVWLDAETAIRATPQGESFTAFHQYLAVQREAMEQRLRVLHIITAAVPDARKADEVWLLPQLLLQECHKVTETIRRVSLQIRQLVTEREERRTLHDLLASVKQSLQSAPGPLTEELPVTVESLPAVYLPLERVPWQPPQRVSAPLAPPAAQVRVADPLAWANLLPGDAVEQATLIAAIERVLARHPEASLADVLVEHPAHYGFEELIAYCLIALDDPRHELVHHERITVFADLDGIIAAYELPFLRFRRVRPLPTEEAKL